MSSRFTEKVNITLNSKRRELFTVQNINKNLLTHNHKKINQETEEIILQIRLHINKIRFNIMTTETKDIVLKLL